MLDEAKKLPNKWSMSVDEALQVLEAK
jgi:hypothetical protein